MSSFIVPWILLDRIRDSKYHSPVSSSRALHVYGSVIVSDYKNIDILLVLYTMSMVKGHPKYQKPSITITSHQWVLVTVTVYTAYN